MCSKFRIFIIWAALCIPIFATAVQRQEGRVVVLFTADLHSQLLPAEDGNGGIARIATIIERERKKAACQGAAFLLLDGGDMAMGSIFHTLFPTEAIEYRTLARLGYDAFTFGNHDFDFGTGPLEKMFYSARSKDSLIKFPVLLSSNLSGFSGAEQHLGGQIGNSEFEIPVNSTLLIERNGLKIGVFGLMGENAYDVIGKDKQRLGFTDYVEAANIAVGKLQREGANYIIALSHGGTLNGDDITLAKKVDGIDLIISGHDHVLLPAPMNINSTSIVAAGAYGECIGKVVLKDGKVVEYELIKVNRDIPEKLQMKQWVDSMSFIVSDYFYKTTGIVLQDTVAFLSEPLPKRVGEDGRMDLGEEIATAYREAAIENLKIKDTSLIIGITPYGPVRRGLNAGYITYNDVFNTLALGENENGYTGYPIVYGWLTGAEIEDLCELNATIAPYLEDTRLFFSGVEYTVGRWRLPFFKIKQVWVNGHPLQKDKLYMVVTSKYTADLIGILKSESFGLLSVQIKDARGTGIPSTNVPIIKDRNGNIITEWEAFAQYLKRKYRFEN